ncbi:MAG: aldo/keto reductase [Bacteroidales bacterium]|nr:aldo/keto reductase [Bacteroidales bacterium]
MERREFIKLSAAAAALAGVSAAVPESKAQNGNPFFRCGNVKRNDPEVGLLGYGCMRWPLQVDEDGRESINQKEVNRLVDMAISHGVNYFDTAPVYHKGESERATAEALLRYPREQWLLATKLSNFSDCSYENSVRMFRNSLSVFKTDYVDYYLLHSVKSADDFKTRFEETGIMDFLLKERSEGHIRHLGFSFHGDNAAMDSVLALHPKYHWDFVQIQMNYLDWKQAGNAEYLYTRLYEMGIPIVIMEPLRGGELAKLPSVLAERLKTAEPDKSLASWAFRFAGSFPGILTVLSGMTYMDNLQENLRTYSEFKPLEKKEFELLENVAHDLGDFNLVPCTGCQYCMPCPYGIDIPGVFRFYNRHVNAGTYVKSPDQENYARVRRRYLADYDKLVNRENQADHCISCGRCTRNCPQKIRIPRELRRIDEYLEKVKREAWDKD